MFHTFQSSVAATSPTDGGDGKTGRAPASRRISTTNACVECRRRKIRCDGAQPCGQCQWYQHPDSCQYSKPQQRVVPSRKLVDKLQNQVEQHARVINRLFPGKDIDSIASLSREELISLALSLPAPATTTPSNDSASQTNRLEETPKSEGAESLEALEQAPDQDPEWDESKRYRDKIQNLSDDVNGLHLSVDKQASYVGVSSITAALKVILKTAPITRPYLSASSNAETALNSRANTPPPEFADPSPTAMPPIEEGHALVESYFERVHWSSPMVDEQRFWATYLYGERKDASWLALLNMVFALGALASSTSDSDYHIAYYRRARQHVDIESFGSANLELLQALGLMSGYYMHYLNRPNEANCLMGATLRMATALGLHREYNESNLPLNAATGNTPLQLARAQSSIPAEIRRRTWWSLVTLDTWASTTTGRPSLGRNGEGVTVQPPGKLPEQHMSNIQSLKLLPLIYSVPICRIATKIQDRLATSPLLKFDELVQIDAELVQWHEDLPPILTNKDEKCPEFLRTPRAVLKWRYQNLRIILHRPFLLNSSLRRVPFAQLPPEEKVAVGKCRIIAAKSIEDISNECTPDLICGWNAVWMLYQACMIPLVSIFCDPSNPDEVDKWRGQLETAMLSFSRMTHWSIAAKKSLDLISKLFEASKNISTSQLSQGPPFTTVPLFPGLPRRTLHNNPEDQSSSTTPSITQRTPVPPPLTSPSQVQQQAQTTYFTQQPHSQTDRTPNQQLLYNQQVDPSAAAGFPQYWQQQNSEINNFWDDMMWDTFPDMSANDFGQDMTGQGEFEWPNAQEGAYGHAGGGYWNGNMEGGEGF